MEIADSYREFEQPDERDIHLFILCKLNKAIGLIILERRSNAGVYSWEECEQQSQQRFRKN